MINKKVQQGFTLVELLVGGAHPKYFGGRAVPQYQKVVDKVRVSEV